MLNTPSGDTHDEDNKKRTDAPAATDVGHLCQIMENTLAVSHDSPLDDDGPPDHRRMAADDVQHHNGQPHGNKEHPPSNSPRYHPDHQDLADDMIVELSDGVRFRVKSKSLAESSEFFRDLLDLPTPSSSQEGIIPLITTSSAALLVMVEYVRQGLIPERSRPCDLTYTFVNDLVRMADAYDLPGLHEAIFFQVPLSVTCPANFIFALLSRRSDTLARAYASQLLPLRDDFAEGSWWALLLQQEFPCQYAISFYRLFSDFRVQ